MIACDEEYQDKAYEKRYNNLDKGWSTQYYVLIAELL